MTTYCSNCAQAHDLSPRGLCALCEYTKAMAVGAKLKDAERRLGSISGTMRAFEADFHKLRSIQKILDRPPE